MGRFGLFVREAEVFEEAFVQAALEGDGAGGVLVEPHERALVRGADPGEAQGASVLAQVQRVYEALSVSKHKRVR